MAGCCDKREGGGEGEKLIKVRRELMGDTSLWGSWMAIDNQNGIPA